jgi:hypothetical protein
MTNTQQAKGSRGNAVEKISSPARTRELHNHHFDSTIWNDLRFRDDDIVIATRRALRELGPACATWLATGGEV